MSIAYTVAGISVGAIVGLTGRERDIRCRHADAQGPLRQGSAGQGLQDSEHECGLWNERAH